MKQALELALEALQFALHVGFPESSESQIKKGEKAYQQHRAAITAIKEALAKLEQEPVAMKFKIYKPTVPDPMRQDINDALLPWVYDQSRGSGFVASMWVTPVSTLSPQRTWVGLKDEEIVHIGVATGLERVAVNMIEAKLKEKNT